MYAYYDLGISCYAGELLDAPESKGVFFCNQLYSYYYDAFEYLVPAGRHKDKAYIDGLAKRRMVNLYNHPNRLLYNTFWDMHNYKGENLYPFGQWVEAERMTDEERKRLLDGIRDLIRTLKADGRFRFVTFGELVEERCTGARMITPSDIPGIHEKLCKEFWPVIEPVSLCISDIFGACVRFLGGARLYTAGRVYGFLDTPYAMDAPVTIKASDVKKAAAEINLDTFLPAAVMVGDAKLGPADFLYAMLEVLEGKDEVILQPREQNLKLDKFPGLIEFPYDKWLFSLDFKAEVLKKRTPLQAWTLRY